MYVGRKVNLKGWGEGGRKAQYIQLGSQERKVTSVIGFVRDSDPG